MSPPEVGNDLVLPPAEEPRRRVRLPERRIAQIRRERRAPRITQWDYLHLRTLRDALCRALAELDLSDGPVLDLYCGTQPYRELIPWHPIVGMDIDLHFGRADVIASGPLPFRDASFSLVICTQALYQVHDAVQAVEEMHRVTRPGGWAIVTVPHIFRRELPWERRYSPDDLRALFAAWSDVDVRPAGGTGSGLAYYGGRLLHGLARRFRPALVALPLFSLPLNAAGALVDTAARPVRHRAPANLLVVARR